jgi:hypothetical protein
MGPMYPTIHSQHLQELNSLFVAYVSIPVWDSLCRVIAQDTATIRLVNPHIVYKQSTTPYTAVDFGTSYR